MVEEKISLGEMIKKARTAAGLTQAEMARRIRVGRSSINMWESDARVPRFEMLKEIIRVTGVNPRFLVPAFEDSIYFTDKERELLAVAEQKNASADLADENYRVDGIELSETEKQKILSYARFIIADRK